MQKFTDASGSVWEVEVDLVAAQRVRRLCELNILEADGSKGIVETLDDPLTLGEVLYAVCKPQADRRNVTEADFLAGVKGTVVTQARRAFQEALIAFFPPPRRDELAALVTRLVALSKRLHRGLTETPGPTSTEPSGGSGSGREA